MSEVSFCQTISYNADNFEYEAVSQENGNATIIKFPIDQKLYSPGDVVVVLANDEINFHGIIGKIELCLCVRPERLAASGNDSVKFIEFIESLLSSLSKRISSLNEFNELNKPNELFSA
jgi:hypothetical protein